MGYGREDVSGEGQWVHPVPLPARPRRRSLRLFAISGIDISLHWTWLIVATLITGSVAMAWLPVVQPSWDGALRWPVAGVCALMFFTSLLLHELAHALVAQRRGIPVLGITLFRFTHRAEEVWRDGRLQALVTTTDDDGTPWHVELRHLAGALRGRVNGEDVELPGDAIPASLWHRDTTTIPVLLDTIDGRMKAVAKFRPTIPRLSRMAASWRSVRLRE